MPACEPRCPIVRTELKRIAAAAPWIRNEQLSSSVKVREAAPLLESTGSLDVQLDDQEQRPAGNLFDSQHPESWLDVMDAVGVKYAKDSRKMVSRDQAVLERKTKENVTKVATQPEQTFTSKAIDSLVSSSSSSSSLSSKTVRSRGDDPLVSTVSTKETVTTTRRPISDKLIETDVVEGTVRHATGSANGLSGRADKMETPSKTDRETIETIETIKQQVTEEREGLATLPDECESTCPRRVSRENRIRKLEERQRTVDAYSLNKGTNYFDDVCTCSLSCVVRGLKDDSFVRSVFTSAALFTLGLKLCMELDSWYLPIRLS